ncbi:hypothetical protein RvY_18579 [Ramazzottius varieornatus]|uniref:Uncharacterized protein n=1 Tax=Ramazzottius varieornatus TaxID=947166 RepID=A0A1D1W7T0_RAMVA|nr:hypothetical protein RvY_18579 [Ramazzottius varieornatus]
MTAKTAFRKVGDSKAAGNKFRDEIRENYKATSEEACAATLRDFLADCKENVTKSRQSSTSRSTATRTTKLNMEDLLTKYEQLKAQKATKHTKGKKRTDGHGTTEEYPLEALLNMDEDAFFELFPMGDHNAVDVGSYDLCDDDNDDGEAKWEVV